jgi:hypothetical protein
MAEGRKTKIHVFKHPAVEARKGKLTRKGKLMLKGRGWRLIKHWGRKTGQLKPAMNFQATLLTTFDVAGKKLAVFEVRDWPA